jgi:hypothetical protein
MAGAIAGHFDSVPVGSVAASTYLLDKARMRIIGRISLVFSREYPT